MTRNYVEAILRTAGKYENVNTVLDILAGNETATSKWNAIDDIDLAGVAISDFIMLAFAAGRNYENAMLSDTICKLFS